MSRLRIASYAPLLSAVGLFGGVVAACVGEDAPSRVSTDTAADAGAIDDAQTDDPDGDADVPDAGPDAAAPGDAGARGTVFVSTAKVDGAFAAGAASPTAAADAICANEALAAGLAGSYVAWLSYEDQNGTKFNAASRIGEMPYYLPAGEDGSAPVLFTAGRLDLVANGSDVPLARTATGAYVDQDENSAVAWAWTGTNGSGEATVATCGGWTSALPTNTGVTGNARRIPSPTSTDWTALGSRPCDVKRRLYCFQKP